ncbi:MAG: hypothetical protein V8T45_04135 [Oscillospiraceae bacterium]
MSYYENALKMRPYIEKAAASLGDAEALEVPTLFPAWADGTSYSTDERIELRRHFVPLRTGPHVPAGLDAPAAPALWVMVSLEEWPAWVQPTGAPRCMRPDPRYPTPASTGYPMWMYKYMGTRCLRLDGGVVMGDDEKSLSRLNYGGLTMSVIENNSTDGRPGQQMTATDTTSSTAGESGEATIAPPQWTRAGNWRGCR